MNEKEFLLKAISKMEKQEKESIPCYSNITFYKGDQQMYNYNTVSNINVDRRKVSNWINKKEHRNNG